MIICFWHQIVSSCFICDKFNISMFSHIFHSFSKNCIIQQLKKDFFFFFAFFLKYVFMSIYDFSEGFWLNLITLRTIFKSNLWFNACLKFLMCVTRSVLWCRLATTFRLFQSLILSGKNGKSLWISCNFSIYWTSTLTKYPLFLYSF